MMDLLAGHDSLCIIGMCKNAGKTTALNYIIKNAGETLLGLTSIGRDGEATDLVTGTKKPGIYIRKNSIIATAAGLLDKCDITKEILENTGIPTPMGEVIIIRARSDGNVQLAGPSIVEQLVTVSERFRAYGMEKIIIDGAISRKTLSTRDLAKSALLCTGASCGKSVDIVVEQTAHACEILTLPEAADRADFAGIGKDDSARMHLMTSDGLRALTDDESIETAAHKYSANTIFINGAVSDASARSMVTSPNVKNLRLIVRDASKILLEKPMWEKMKIKNITIETMAEIRLAAITVNPFSAYGLHFDAKELLEKMQAAVSIPVINVEDET